MNTGFPLSNSIVQRTRGGRRGISRQPSVFLLLTVDAAKSRMPREFKHILRREVEVALTQNPQPLWARVLKYVVLTALIFFFHRSKTFWILLGVAVLLALLVHFWYRYKTAGWTKSYGGWEYKESEPDKQ